MRIVDIDNQRINLFNREDLEPTQKDIPMFRNGLRIKQMIEPFLQEQRTRDDLLYFIPFLIVSYLNR